MKLRILVFAIVVLAMGTLVSLNGCGGSGGSTPPPGKIQHVVVIFQENRTPDNLFQDPILIAHGAHIASSGKTSTGQIVPQAHPAGGGVGYGAQPSQFPDRLGQWRHGWF
jgi:hypothetical protein